MNTATAHALDDFDLRLIAMNSTVDGSIEFAKQLAAMTRSPLADVLDRLDAADPRTITARNVLVSGDNPHRDRAREYFDIDVETGIFHYHLDAPYGSSLLG